MDQEDMFWSMLINFNSFGSVAMFNKKCACNFQKLPYKLRKQREFYDDIFSRAKKSTTDVQCMFSTSEEGCGRYLRSGKNGSMSCPFKHEAFVKMSKKQKQRESRPQED